MGWATGAWATGAWRGTAWAEQGALVEVPDVVGETQAAGTTTLEGDAFVVAVATAYSSTVDAGLIISQAPAGGEFANNGSTVTITVSLGPEPVTDTSGGGWYVRYEQERERRRRKRREQEEAEDEAKRIADETSREIALLLRKQEAEDERRAELKRLSALAKQFNDTKAATIYGERVAKALERAAAQANFSALEALDRELRRVREEDEFLFTALAQLLREDD